MLIQQSRAKHALQFVRETGGGSDPKRFAALAKKLPVMVQQNGLGQALLFVLANGKDSGKHIYSLIDEWLKERELVDRESNALDYLIWQADREGYLAAQEETIALAVWLKKFTEAFVDSGEG